MHFCICFCIILLKKNKKNLNEKKRKTPERCHLRRSSEFFVTFEQI